MTVLRTWSGRQALAGIVACFVALQSLVAGLHAAHSVDLQLLANDLASICHGGKSDTGGSTPPRSDHTGACCLPGCNVAGQSARLAEVSSFAPPALDATRVASPIPSFAPPPSHLIDGAHRPRSPPMA
jgi:hypothetical protein